MRPHFGGIAGCTMSVSLSLGGSLGLGQQAAAAEYGLGDYLLGLTVPMSGYTPPPGVYFSDTFYLYEGNDPRNVDFPIGRITAAGLTYNFLVDIASVAWFTEAKVLGATLGLAALVPFGSDTNSASISFLGSGRLAGPEVSMPLGDCAFSAILGWEEGEHHWNFTLTGPGLPGRGAWG